MKSFEGKTVWVTGASSGIGEALAYQLSKEGANLIISARRIEELERVKENCANPDQVRVLKVDLADAFSLPQKAKEAETFFEEGIDLLINNGGVSQRERAIDTKIEVDRQIMEINYFGTIGLTKAVLKGMVERKKGHFVVITSAVGIISTPLRSSYAAAKHALHGFFDSLRTEHYDDNIGVTIALPGFIKTNISINALVGDGSKQNTMDKAQANGMTAEECARQILLAVRRNKEEVYIGGLKEKMGIYAKRFFPKLFSIMVRKMSVT